MKKYKDLGIYDFSDYAEEITGDDLFKINGGATSCSNVAPSGPSGGSGGNTNQGTVKPATTGNGQGGDSGTGTSPTGGSSTPTQGSGGPSGGNNPGGPTGPSGPSAPDIPAEIKENPYAYAAYMSLQGKAKEEGDPDKYKEYNVLGSGKVQVTIDYWATTSRIGSAHYVIGIDGKIYQAIPENEQARHAGNNEGKYMDKATELFGDGINPNIYSIGIEMEPLTVNGDVSSATYSSAVTLASSLCNKYSLNPETSLIRHYDVTGKNCPKYFVNYGNEWEIFKTDVLKVMGQ